MFRSDSSGRVMKMSCTPSTELLRMSRQKHFEYTPRTGKDRSTDYFACECECLGIQSSIKMSQHPFGFYYPHLRLAVYVIRKDSLKLFSWNPVGVCVCGRGGGGV